MIEWNRLSCRSSHRQKNSVRKKAEQAEREVKDLLGHHGDAPYGATDDYFVLTAKS
jgi:hypothetical protein